ncbi:hypothetical protein RB199_27455 [Streptomyces libani]
MSHASRPPAPPPSATVSSPVSGSCKDAALQAVGRGLSLAPERIEAGFPGDRGTVTVPGPHGLDVPVSVRNIAFSSAYEFAVAVPEPLALTPAFSYPVG